MPYCRNCGSQLQEADNYCEICGTDKREASPKASFTGKTCPFCQFPIKQDSETVQCSSCKVPHHMECWQGNGGCTTFGCRGLSSAQTSNSYWNSEVLDINLDEHDNLQDTSALLTNRRSCYGRFENTNPYYPKANIGSRVVAFVTDFAVWLIITAIVPIFALYSFNWSFNNLEQSIFFPVLVITVLLGIYGFLVRDKYLPKLVSVFGKQYDFFNIKRGDICGKAKNNLIVIILKDHEPCDAKQSFIRNLFLFFLPVLMVVITRPLFTYISILTFVFMTGLMVDFVIAILHPQGRRLGDLIANTQVVDFDHYMSLVDRK